MATNTSNSTMGTNHHNFFFHKKLNISLKRTTGFLINMRHNYTIFKQIGFLLGLIAVIVVLGSVLTGSISQNLLVILTLLGINLFVAIVLPRAFSQNAIAIQLQDGLHYFGQAVNKIVISGLLFFVYVAAVGLAWIVSRVLQKRFLQLKTTSSTWVNVKNKKIDFEEMF